MAIAAVHWSAGWNTLPELLIGYRITDKAGDGFGNYKLPLLFIIMLIPLTLKGAGNLSQHHTIKKYVQLKSMFIQKVHLTEKYISLKQAKQADHI